MMWLLKNEMMFLFMERWRQPEKAAAQMVAEGSTRKDSQREQKLNKIERIQQWH